MTLLEQQVQGLLNGFTDEYKDQLRVRDEKIDSLLQTTIANQPIIDGLITNPGRTVSAQTKSVEQQIAEALSTRKPEYESFAAGEIKNFRINLDKKTSGVLLQSDHLTGNAMTTYANDGAILPSHAVNFRDLIPTVTVNNGSYTFYREGAVTNSVAAHVENNAKASQDYTWSEIRTDCFYLAAKTVFSKKFAHNVNFLQNTIARQLMRDYMRAENSYMYTTVAVAALGTSTVSNPTPTEDVEELVGVIANQIQSGYDASVVVIDPQEWRRLVNTKPTSYSTPAAFTVDSSGMLRINGTPIVVAPWSQTDKVLVFDNSVVKNIVGESLRIEFSYEDGDNFSKNNVTARVESYMNVAIERPDGVIYHDFSNS
jgi:hypothetical protein